MTPKKPRAMPNHSMRFGQYPRNPEKRATQIGTVAIPTAAMPEPMESWA